MYEIFITIQNKDGHTIVEKVYRQEELDQFGDKENLVYELAQEAKENESKMTNPF
jgi:hypothetical protein